MSVDLSTITLSHGAHDDRADGVCLLEVVAWLAGEDHTDRPACVSEVLASFGRALNDALLPAREDLEARLRLLAPRLIGTVGQPDLDQRAGLMAANWFVRVYTPVWLRLAGLTEHADTLAHGVDIGSWDDLPIGALQSAQHDARIARRAAWDTAEVRATAAGAWRGAAGNAAWGAAEVRAICTPAWDAAWAAAWDAVWDAACAAACAAKDAALASTVRELQDSALDLFERMIALWCDGPGEDTDEIEEG